MPKVTKSKKNKAKPYKMNTSTRRSSRSRGLTTTEKRQLNNAKREKNEEERKRKTEIKKLSKKYKGKPHLLQAELNRNNTLEKLPDLFKLSKLSTPKKSSPKNPFMVKNENLSMEGLLNSILKMNIRNRKK